MHRLACLSADKHWKMIRFERHSGIYTLTASQDLPVDPDTAWEFFSGPENLQKITPPEMSFTITSGKTEKAYPGQIITYRVSPFPGLRLPWVTEITSVEEGRRFVDEQRFGPYAMWHHEHRFAPIPGGVRMTDKVSYKLPLGPLGHLAHALFVKARLRHIFAYRERVLTGLFGNYTPAGTTVEVA